MLLIQSRRDKGAATRLYLEFSGTIFILKEANIYFEDLEVILHFAQLYYLQSDPSIEYIIYCHHLLLDSLQ